MKKGFTLHESTREGKNVSKTEALPSFSCALQDQLTVFKKAYHYGESNDVIIREFFITVNGVKTSAAIIFIDGLVARDTVNRSILQPLMVDSFRFHCESLNDALNIFLPQFQTLVTDDYSKLFHELNYGGCIILIDGAENGIAADVKGWDRRSVGTSETEAVIIGPHEAFTEGLRTNTSMLRRIIRNEHMVTKSVELGTDCLKICTVVYIDNLVDETLLQEVIRRLEGIKVDYLLSSSELEQFLEDDTVLTLPQMLSTDRPDRTARAVLDGKIALILDGSPYALILPATIGDLLSTSDDAYMRYPFSVFIRGVRFLGIAISLLLPAIYIAITNFHPEMLPADLVVSIVASREKVPFPSLFELVVMELSFEIIREAGVRIPGAVGSTLGIIGGLIMGQAAVSANIVSPILIIVVSLTGIGSFATPSYKFGVSIRILRFAYIALAAMAGMFGVTAGLFVHLTLWCSAKSMGVHMMAPFAPWEKGVLQELFLLPIWQRDLRPDAVNAQKPKNQPKISRKWR